jgi:cytochrome oxidase Cu insertion factor (SCO1/SenC/PrrC family)
MHRNRLNAAFLATALAAGLATTAGQAQQNAKVAHTNLKVGDTAPDFTLLDNHWKPVHLSDYRGKKNVVLAFYVLAFTGG